LIERERERKREREREREIESNKKENASRITVWSVTFFRMFVTTLVFRRKQPVVAQVARAIIVKEKERDKERSSKAVASMFTSV
jgi:hypothetical protein